MFGTRGAPIPYVDLATTRITVFDQRRRVYKHGEYIYLDTKPEVYLNGVKRCGRGLQFIREEHQTPEICEAAVRQDGTAINFVVHQTPELCRIAVDQNPNALEFVRDQTVDLCRRAIKRDPLTIRHVRNQTPELCMEALKRNFHLLDMRYQFGLKYIREPTDEMRAYAKERSVRSCIESGIQSYNALTQPKEKLVWRPTQYLPTGEIPGEYVKIMVVPKQKKYDPVLRKYVYEPISYDPLTVYLKQAITLANNDKEYVIDMLRNEYPNDFRNEAIATL